MYGRIAYTYEIVIYAQRALDTIVSKEKKHLLKLK